MRNNISDFEFANPPYAGATVTIYTVSGGVKTTTRATLYKDLTSSDTLLNPQQLDVKGMFQQPVYVDVPVVITVSGLTIPDHDTGIIQVSLASSAGDIHSAASKTTPVDADEFGIWDSAVGILKKLTWANLSQYLKFTPAGTGAVATTVQTKLRESVSVTDFGGSTVASDNTAAFALAVTYAIANNVAIRVPAGTWNGTLSIRGNNVSVIGDGSAVTTIKHPVKAITNVLELGNTAAGNGATAYSGITVRGITLDGNRASVTIGSDDLTGHGLPMTKISNFHISDVRAINCHNAGVGVFIDSNFGYADCYVENCGNAAFTGNGFDINSSKYGTFNVVSKNCYAGGRILGNCYGNNLTISVYNTTKDGFNYNNQSTNSSYANNIDVTVYTCGQHGLNIGKNCLNSNIRATVYNAANYGCVLGEGTGHPSTNNNIDLITYNSAYTGLLIKYDGNDNIIKHQSNLDGRSGAQGSFFSDDISGNRNKLIVDMIDSSTWQVRGIVMRASALDNEILSYSFTNTADPYGDGAANTRTKVNHGQGRGVDIASASQINIPILGTIFHVTGTTGITAIAGAGKEEFVTLIFDNILTVTKGGNLRLGAGGNFVSTANSTLSGIWDGTNFYETGRSVT